MSSSERDNRLLKQKDIEKAWNYAIEGSRGDVMEVIVEEFIDFDYEITLNTDTRQWQHALLPTYWTPTRTR